MTEEIRLMQAGLEHMTKAPEGRRYSLFCDEVLVGTGDCVYKRKFGHIGDYGNYQSARVDALKHQHAALIRFYPDFENKTPSDDFLRDFSIAQEIARELR